ncbi:MAG: nicotinamide-nucleotide amidohydrolase family protein [Lentilactobacillus hilgardii]|uniref:CinA family protein n=1 Tax=Lentilactobacillus hilgardii TaxID=1588 RepID=UPI001CC1DE46|nr:nicotinamide-nucleotide amidohydrolase family protein [Lentilactobacillus hilgardii]MCI1922725.1 nicotinamide-nucleotide amidohydrolase family protein [Lentilactobacillus buchneri]MBZ2201415.1 competence protein [Lentilactobacillus hilgardii]MBZ2204330.1 competence protein [Lentilactobacillus hilgardii]MCI1950335.1 nicotinamide-nucleotide amidohydrolase family protein [Lentilactobacillus buchneri]MCI2018484.1 nicotinamide-nucleotide amidohydrolase family protein [Lentilactobacillus buchneri
MSLEQKLVEQLLKKHITITAAESLTAGLFQSTLGNVSGVSKVFEGGFVTYSDKVKEQLLHVPHDVIAENSVVSEPTAIWMADQARRIMDKDLAVSFTGVAGPDALEGNPVGTVWIGIAFGAQISYAKKFQFEGLRNQIREAAVEAGLKMALSVITSNK